LVLKTNFFYMP